MQLVLSLNVLFGKFSNLHEGRGISVVNFMCPAANIRILSMLFFFFSWTNLKQIPKTKHCVPQVFQGSMYFKRCPDRTLPSFSKEGNEVLSVGFHLICSSPIFKMNL